MTPLSVFLPFFTMAQVAEASRQCVTFILFCTALYLYFQAVEWTARRIVIEEERAQETRDLEILYAASLAYIARRDAARFAPVQDDDNRAFLCDDDTPLDLSA